MTKFKKGDLVKCISVDDSGVLKLNQIYKVSDPDYIPLHKGINLEGFENFRFYEKRFELAEGLSNETAIAHENEAEPFPLIYDDLKPGKMYRVSFDAIMQSDGLWKGGALGPIKADATMVTNGWNLTFEEISFDGYKPGDKVQHCKYGLVYNVVYVQGDQLCCQRDGKLSIYELKDVRKFYGHDI